jgi:hypothetical protein
MPTTSTHSGAATLPEAAIDWVRAVFAAVNRRVTETLSRIPTHHEPELDMQLIAALNQTPAVTDVSGWTVYIQTHFLGGRRHFYNWEVADIGLLVVFRDRGKVLRTKVGLLQSKRLYSREVAQLPDHALRTRIGFGTLLQSPEAFRALAAGRTFAFDEESRYLALEKDSEQQRALAAYEKMSGIPIYYLLYNPIELPWSAKVPASDLVQLPATQVGCRVVRARAVDGSMDACAAGFHPSYRDIAALPPPFVDEHKAGWTLEHFVADELLRCREGHVATGETDHVLEQLLYNRSGPIAAAIAVTVEAPDGVDFALPELPASDTSQG